MRWLSRWDKRNQRVVDEHRDPYLRVVPSPTGDRYYEMTARPDAGIATALDASFIGFVVGLVIDFLDWVLRRRRRGGVVEVVVRSARSGETVATRSVATMHEAAALLDEWEPIIQARGPDGLPSWPPPTGDVTR